VVSAGAQRCGPRLRHIAGSLDAVIEDLECFAAAPGDLDALMRLTELRDGLRIARERCRSKPMLSLMPKSLDAAQRADR